MLKKLEVGSKKPRRKAAPPRRPRRDRRRRSRKLATEEASDILLPAGKEDEREIAQAYGVTPRCVLSIWSGRIWARLPESPRHHHEARP